VGRLSVIILASIFSLSSAHANWFKQQQDIMGTRVSVELWHANESLARQCSDKIFAEMHRLDAMMSPFQPDSEISLINNNASTETIEVSDEMAEVIDRSLYFSKISNGAFDITFASIGYRYDYRNKVKPSDQLIESSLPSIDYRHINLKNNALRFDDAGVRIDLGGIAKGYAVDRAIEIAGQCGISEALISAGGDTRILGRKRGKPWIIGIQHPRKENELALVLPLSDTAISTSGDYERFFIRDGQRIHHIINPSTGKSATASWSATVTGPDAMTTDALSTTIFVLGAIKGIALIETLNNIDAIIIDNQGKVHYSSGLQEPPPND
jgi:thiamine biosynthesis lipoprotein